jgi:CP family cyanate transporter-like MFS transporter
MRRDRVGVAILLGVVLVVGLALRTQVAAVAPLIARMQQAFDLPFLLAGWLTAIPVVFLGVMAFAGPLVAGIAGTRAAIAWSMLLVVVFGVWRAFADDAAVLLLTTLPLGVGLGLASSLIPAAVRALDRTMHGPAMGFFALGLQAGTGGAAAVAVPLALLLGGWRESLLALVVPVVIGMIVWIALWPQARDDHGAGRASILPRTTVGLVGVFGVQAFVFYSTLTWLPARLMEVDWSEAGAGATLGLLNGLAMIGTLVVAAWCRNFRMRLVMTVWGSLALAVGLALIAVDPARTIAWACIAGVAFGTLFPIALTLPLDYAHDSHDALRLSAGTLGLGYLVSSAGSTLSGGLRDLSGSFEPVFLALALIGLLPCMAVLALRRRPLPEDGAPGQRPQPAPDSRRPPRAPH